MCCKDWKAMKQTWAESSSKQRWQLQVCIQVCATKALDRKPSARKDGHFPNRQYKAGGQPLPARLLNVKPEHPNATSAPANTHTAND